MDPSRAIKVYRIANSRKEEYVTTVFSADDALKLGNRINKEMFAVAAVFKKLDDTHISTLRRHKKIKKGRPARFIRGTK